MIPGVPEFVLKWVEQYLPLLLGWFSQRMYERLLKREASHFLVQLDAQVDLSTIEQGCWGFYKDNGLGRARTHSVRQLCRALLLKYLYAESLRQCAERLRYNWLARWFVGYSLFEPTPDHSTLARFEQWVRREQPRLFFDAVLRQIDRAFPDQAQQAQIGDTFALRADAAVESLLERVRHGQRGLLALTEAVDVELLRQVQHAAGRSAFKGAAQMPPEYRMTQEEWYAQLEQAVRRMVLCMRTVRTQLRPYSLAVERVAPLVQWLTYLDKLLADEFRLSYDEQGELTQVQRLPKGQRGSYRLISMTDPEATFRVHDKDEVLGYNISLAATRMFIREIRADTGAQPDGVAIPELLRAQQAHHYPLPPKLIYDRAAGRGKLLAAVAELSAGQTRLVAQLIDLEQRHARFGPTDFSLSLDGQRLRCPNGQESTQKYRSGDKPAVVFRFKARQCQSCPLWKQCRDPNSPPTALRQVFISDYWLTLLQARAYCQTEAFRQDLKLRPVIEQTIALLVRDYGARLTRVRLALHF